MQRGTGIRFLPGTACRFDGGSRPFNPAISPFSSNGDVLTNRNSLEWAQRYCGGDINLVFRKPENGAEWMMFMGIGLEMAAQGLIELPAGAYFAPGPFDRISTLEERTDAEYCASEMWCGIAAWNALPPEPGGGKRPDMPMPVNRPDIPYRYFTEEHQTFNGITVYFQNVSSNSKGFAPGYPAQEGQKELEALAVLRGIKTASDALVAAIPSKGGLPMQEFTKKVRKLTDLIDMQWRDMSIAVTVGETINGRTDMQVTRSRQDYSLDRRFKQ